MLAPGFLDVEPMLPPLRPMREFLAYTSISGHKQPIQNRLLDNLTFYQTNYLLINMIMLVLGLMFSYLIIIVAPLCFSIFFFLAYYKQDHVIAFRRFKITKNFAIISGLVALVILVVFSGQYKTLFVGYFLTMFTVLGHAALTDRKRSQPSYNEQGRSSPTSKIFDPEELIRREEMQRRSFQPVGVSSGASYSSSNRFSAPGQPSYEQTSFESGEQSTGVSSSVGGDSMSDSKASREAKREKNKQTRQRIKENYGLIDTQ